MSAIHVNYRNYRGEASARWVTPIAFYYGINDWHAEEGWYLLAYDHSKQAERHFALTECTFQRWLPIASAPKDGTEVWVWVEGREGLPAFQTRCAWHEDAGWCADELREVTHWRPMPAGPGAEAPPAAVPVQIFGDPEAGPAEAEAALQQQPRGGGAGGSADPYNALQRQLETGEKPEGETPEGMRPIEPEERLPAEIIANACALLPLQMNQEMFRQFLFGVMTGFSIPVPHMLEILRSVASTAVDFQNHPEWFSPVTKDDLPKKRLN